MTSHRNTQSADPMRRSGPIQPMDPHDEWLAGLRPSFPWARFIRGVLIGAALFVAGVFVAAVMP